MTQRTIEKIIIHCSDSDNSDHDNIETIRRWHVEENGWRDVGYHYVILKSGAIEIGRALHEPGAHTKGHNFDSIGICLTGRNDFSAFQFATLNVLVHELCIHFGLSKHDVYGHRDFSKTKTCPNFDVREALSE